MHEPADSPRRVSLGESLADEDSSPENQLHLAASVGDLIALQSILKDSNDKLLHSKDDNDWQAIHEAVRGGHLDCVKFLISKGADLSSRVADGGASLWLARRFLLPDDPVIEYLISIGAPEDEEL